MSSSMPCMTIGMTVFISVSLTLYIEITAAQTMYWRICDRVMFVMKSRLFS